jgi:hypothetical protein
MCESLTRQGATPANCNTFGHFGAAFITNGDGTCGMPRPTRGHATEILKVFLNLRAIVFSGTIRRDPIIPIIEDHAFCHVNHA